jgi:hypothetical protein
LLAPEPSYEQGPGFTSADLNFITTIFTTMAKAVQVGDVLFKTQKAAEEYTRKILYGYATEVTIEEDHQFLCDLVQRHPSAHEKIGLGVKRFFTRKTEQGTICFWLERVDGSQTDFSFKQCISQKGPSLYQRVMAACREVVNPDLWTAKRQFFKDNADADGKVPCEITGESLSYNESTIDHKAPMTFDVLVRTFLAGQQIEMSEDMLFAHGDGDTTHRFVDSSIAESFRRYHHGLASLRLIGPSENFSLGGKERIREAKNPLLLAGPEPE